MERRLVKGTLYGFLLGLCLAILYVDDSKSIHVNGGVTEYPLSNRAYMLALLRPAVKLALTAFAVLLLREWLSRRSSGNASFLKDFAFAFLFVVVLAIVVIPLIANLF